MVGKEETENMRGVCARNKIYPLTSKSGSKEILGTTNNKDRGREVCGVSEEGVAWLELWIFMEGQNFED